MFAQNLPELCQNWPKFAAIQNPDASGTHPDASGRIRNRYQFRRNLRLANRPSFSARSSARPAAALRDLSIGTEPIEVPALAASAAASSACAASTSAAVGGGSGGGAVPKLDLTPS